MQYKAAVSNGTCSDSSNTISLTVVPKPTSGTITFSDSICINTTSTISLSGNSAPFKWQYALDDINWTELGSSLTPETIAPTTNQSPLYYRAVVSNGTCESATTSAKIIVVEPKGGTITLDDPSICDGSNTNLHLTGQTGTSISWEASENGGAWNAISGTTNSLNVSPSLSQSPTTYRAVIKLGSTCFAYSNEATLTITPPAVGGDAKLNDAAVCNKKSTTLNLTNHSGNIRWESSEDKTNWTTLSNTTSSHLVTPTLISNYTYYQAIVTLGNCSDTSTIDSVLVNDVNGGSSSSLNDTICSGNTATINLINEIGTIQWEQLLPNNTTVSLTGTGNSLIINPSTQESPAKYRALLTNTTCTDYSNYTTIIVDTVPTQSITISGKDSICGNSIHTYTIAAIANATSYTWTSTAGTFINLTDTKIEITAQNNTSNNQVSITASNKCGNGLKETLPITTLQLPTPFIVGNDTLICKEGQATLLANNLQGISPLFQYEWTKNNSVLTNPSATLITKEEGLYNLSIGYEGDLCKTTSSNLVRVSFFNMIVDAGLSKEILQGDAVLLDAQADGNFTYSWTPTENLNNNTLLQPLANPKETTTYTITATNDAGCTDTSSVTLKVNKLLTIPNAFSPNGDRINDEWVIENINQWAPLQVQIFNRWGAILYENYNEYIPWDGKFNGKDIPVGTYYFIITIKNHQPFTGALTITR